jgi:chemotaxis protein methyltransferase CheR
MQTTGNDILHSIHHHLGKAAKMYDDAFVVQAIEKLAQTATNGNVYDFLKMLDTNSAEKTKALQSLLIGYSAFYREPLTFAILNEMVLPQLIRQKKTSKNKELRIWSAACAEGQEAYTIAMLLEKHFSSKADAVSYRIFATDANPVQIIAARKGFFHEKSLENLPLKMVTDWFDKKDGGYKINDTLKEKIHFSVFDLLDPVLTSPPSSIFGDFDLIICANLLFYYKSKYRKNIMQKIKYALSFNGLLVTGQTETGIAKSFNFKPVFPDIPVFEMNNNLNQVNVPKSIVD